MKRTVLFMFISTFLLTGYKSMANCNLITVHYNERIPYLHKNGTSVEGLTATPASIAFRKAGIRFHWRDTPSKRQLKIIKDNKGCDCAVGWFKNSEREKFAKYTHYIYQDKPQIALARADNKNLHSGEKIDSILSDQKLVLIVKDGYSYGHYLDSKIAQFKPHIEKTTGENINMLCIVHARHGDYFFIAPEEADALIKSSGFPRKDFKYIEFSDMPKGEKRYILCSKKVGDDVIEELDKAIKNMF